MSLKKPREAIKSYSDGLTYLKKATLPKDKVDKLKVGPYSVELCVPHRNGHLAGFLGVLIFAEKKVHSMRAVNVNKNTSQ